MTEERERADAISRRKLEHLELALAGGVDGPDGAWWNDVHLVHNALPEIDLCDVDLTTSFLGGRLQAPLWITGMTGGHPKAAVLNARLARAAERHGLAMGLGSQRAGLVSGSLRSSYSVAREAAPSAFLIANIGAPQLIWQEGTPPLTMQDIRGLVDSIGAQALAVHLNFLQEMVQPEGDRRALGALAAIRSVCGAVGVPVMAKETGGGIDRATALALRDAGVAAIDVGGSGGTSMVRIEGARSGDAAKNSLAATFDSWGIPTAASLLETRDCGLPVVATGGVRTGLDAARALALGAHAVGVGRPFLAAADRGDEALQTAIETFLHELSVALFLSGCRTPADLGERGAVIFGNLRMWQVQRSSG